MSVVSESLGSARVSRAGFGVVAETIFSLRCLPRRRDVTRRSESAIARTRSPARETRALPIHAASALVLALLILGRSASLLHKPIQLRNQPFWLWRRFCLR